MAVKDFLQHTREDGGVVATFPSGLQIVVPPSGDIATMFSLGVSTTVTREEACDFLGIPVPSAPDQAPTLSSLEPETAEVGSADLELHVKGSRFTDKSVIVFNGGEEPTTFVSAGEVTTTIKPSIASGAAV